MDVFTKASLANQSLLDSCELFAQLSEGVEDNAAYTVYNAPCTFWYNRNALKPGNDALLPETLTEITDGVKSGTRPPLVSYPDFSFPDSMPQLMTDAGYAKLVTQRAMYFDLSLWKKREISENVEYLEAPELRVWSKVNSAAFGKPEEFGGFKLSLGKDGFYYYLYREYGKIVGTTLLIVKDGNAGIHEVGTLEEHRRKGICSALLSKAFNDAVDLGCTCATLQASPVGALTYETLGMEDVGGITSWIFKG